MADKRWFLRANVTGQDGVELGYWASRWLEFKRLFKQMAWENDMNRAIFITSPLVISVALFGAKFLGWR